MKYFPPHSIAFNNGRINISFVVFVVGIVRLNAMRVRVEEKEWQDHKVCMKCVTFQITKCLITKSLVCDKLRQTCRVSELCYIIPLTCNKEVNQDLSVARIAI